MKQYRNTRTGVVFNSPVPISGYPWELVEPETQKETVKTNEKEVEKTESKPEPEVVQPEVKALEKLTNEELKQILRKRGIKDFPNRANKETLIQYVKNTEK